MPNLLNSKNPQYLLCLKNPPDLTFIIRIMLQQETLTYSFVCIYFLVTAFCFYVFMLRQQIEQTLISLIRKVTGVDIEILAFTSSTGTAIALKAALACIKAFLYTHGLLAVMLVVGVLVELI